MSRSDAVGRYLANGLREANEDHQRAERAKIAAEVASARRAAIEECERIARENNNSGEGGIIADAIAKLKDTP